MAIRVPTTTKLALAALLAALAGCSSNSDDTGGAGGTFSTGGFGATGGFGGFASMDGGFAANGGGAATGGDDGDGGVNTGNACATGTATAELTPVNMLVMFDRSGSMNDNNKWPNATAALTSFFQNPGSTGLRVALRFFPHDSPAAGCTNNSTTGCNAVACSQPLVAIGELTADSAPTDSHEAALVGAIVNSPPAMRGGGGGGGGTPIYAALDGALRWATSHKAMFPNENTVVIFVTDGEPNGCDENFDNISALAANALATSNIRTYAIGLEGSSMAQMDQLAAAGGTTQGIFIGNSANAEQELLTALNAIRGQNLSCDFPMPQPSDPTMPIDPARVNITVTEGSGTVSTIGQTTDGASCADSKSWYYDNPTTPTRIFLCPEACTYVREHSDARLEILIGCATACSGVDVNCGGGGLPMLPPLL